MKWKITAWWLAVRKSVESKLQEPAVLVDEAGCAWELGAPLGQILVGLGSFKCLCDI